MSEPPADPLFAEPSDGGKVGDDALLDILEAAMADERTAQEKYRKGFERCADPEACRMFEQLLREEEAHERALAHRHAEVKKRLGLGGAARL